MWNCIIHFKYNIEIEIHRIKLLWINNEINTCGEI